MQVWLRLLIVWCIALALPVQATAGVTMAHCGSSHARMGAAMEAPQHRHASREAGAAHRHAAAAADAAAQPAHDTAAQAKSQSGKMSDLAPYKCSSCASCCAGSALLSAPPRLPEPTAASAVFAEVMVVVDAFATDGPDRPPRVRPV